MRVWLKRIRKFGLKLAAVGLMVIGGLMIMSSLVVDKLPAPGVVGEWAVIGTLVSGAGVGLWLAAGMGDMSLK